MISRGVGGHIGFEKKSNEWNFAHPPKIFSYTYINSYQSLKKSVLHFHLKCDFLLTIPSGIGLHLRLYCWKIINPFVRSSVCHTGILSKRLSISSKFFSPSDKQHTILVFRTERTVWYSDRASCETGDMKQVQLSQKSRAIVEFYFYSTIITALIKLELILRPCRIF